MLNIENNGIFSEEIITSGSKMCTLPNESKSGPYPGQFNGHEHSAKYHANSIKSHTFAFWTIVILLFILTVGNLLLTITIIGVLKLGKGMQGMELIPEEDVIKFYGDTDLDRIYNKCNSQIDGFEDEPINISSDDSSVVIKVNRNGVHNKIILDKNGISMKGVNAFEVKDPHGGETILTTHRPHYVTQGTENLISKVAGTTKITSPIGRPLGILSEDNKILVKGSEGIAIDAQGVFVLSEDRIAINSTQGSIWLNGNDGVFLDIDKIPIASPEYVIRKGTLQYKICVCMPHGKLFRIPVPRTQTGKITCAHFSTDNEDNPCL